MFSNLNTLYIILEAVAYWAATVGSAQAVFLMQFNLDSSPAMCIIKHMPPWRSVSENEGLSSADLAVPPTEKRPNPKIRAFKTNRMSKLVKLSVRTSEVDDALAKILGLLRRVHCLRLPAHSLERRPLRQFRRDISSLGTISMSLFSCTTHYLELVTRCPH